MFLLVATLIVVAFIAYPILRAARATLTYVPEGHYGYDGHAFYPPGPVHTLYTVTMIDMSDRVASVHFAMMMNGQGKVRRSLITWRPDKANLGNFVKCPDVNAELQRLFSTLPDLDLPHYAKVLGIEIVKFERDVKPRKEGVSLGDDVEIQY